MLKQTLQRHPLLRRLLLPVCAVFACALWGSAFPAVKAGFTYFDVVDMPTRIAFAGLRFILAGLMLLLLVPGKAELFRKAPKGLLFAAAFTQVCMQYFFFYWGLSLVSASISAIIVGTGSLWWVLAAPLVDKKEPLSAGKLAILLLGFGGVVVCMLEPGNTMLLGGALLVMIATLSGTAALLMVRPLNRTVPVLYITGFSLFTGGALFLVLTPVRSLEIILQAPWQLNVLILYLAFLSATAFSLWYWLITLYDVARLSAYRFLIPIFGVLESVVFLADESLDTRILTGGGLVIVSILLLEALKQREQQQENRLKPRA